MNWTEWIDVSSESGNILRSRRDGESGITEIQFRPRKEGEKPAHYRSSKPLSETEWKAFSATFDNKGNSTGNHFHSNLRGTKDFKKL